MLKKILATLVITTIFTVQVNAATNEVRALSGVSSSVKEELKTAYDELNYSLTVEWDQKDQAFRTNKMNEFSASVRELQAKGLTSAELIDFAKSQVKDTKVASDIGAAFTMVEINKMTPSEANQYVTETMKKSYSTGASWHGNGGGDFLYTLFLIGLIAVLVAASASTPTPTTTTYATTCSYQYVYVCGYDLYYNYSCYYDYQYLCY